MTTTTDDGPEDENESHWQDRVSSGFDRLVAFASTELDKTRRSIEEMGPSGGGVGGGTGGSGSGVSESMGGSHITGRGESPDSGITHRVMSSTSSSASSASQSESSSVISGQSKLTVQPVKMSPADAASEKSSPPQTPSPSVSPALLNHHHQQQHQLAARLLKIPLKYQRQSSKTEKHYKKKFRDRKWEYDFEEQQLSGHDGSEAAADGTPKMMGEYNHDHRPENLAINKEEEEEEDSFEHNSHHHYHHHKTSKFRPKGKDWGSRTHLDSIPD